MDDSLRDLVEYLNRYLNIGGFHDTAENGLQVENSRGIEKVGVAVDACLESIESAAEAGCHLLMVHHGLFWGASIPVRGIHYDRISALIRSDMALYACHLPLDAHPEVGNNAQIAMRLGLEQREPFCMYSGAFIGFKGVLPRPLSREEAMAICRETIGHETTTFPFGPDRISRAGVVSGSASDPSLFLEAAQSGVELLITGEPRQSAYYLAKEYRLNVFYGGHYATEVFGIRALGDHIADHRGLAVQFVDTACPV